MHRIIKRGLVAGAILLGIGSYLQERPLPLEASHRAIERPSPRDLQTTISAIAAMHGLDPAVLRAIAYQESRFRTDACSSKGACGLMQLMPQTASYLGVADRADPIASIDGGARYLKALLAAHGGNLGLALASYNAGPGKVRRWLRGGAKRNSLPRETRDYVAAITGVDVMVWAGKARGISELIGMLSPSDHISRFR